MILIRHLKNGTFKVQQAQSYGESQAMRESKGLRRMVQEFIDLISTFEVHS